MDKKIYIFAGHYGSGKTELALNFAFKSAQEGNKTVIIDFDVVNPYFRTNDVRAELSEKNIRVMAPVYANTNLDIPALPGEIQSVFGMNDAVRIFDVGGDGDGAFALGQYKRFFDEEDYSMFFVANTRRPLTSTAEGMTEVFDAIETASRLKFTAVINNTNLSELTDEAVIRSGFDEVNRLAQMKGIPVAAVSGVGSAIKNINENVFEIKTYLKKPWE